MIEGWDRLNSKQKSKVKNLVPKGAEVFKVESYRGTRLNSDSRFHQHENMQVHFRYLGKEYRAIVSGHSGGLPQGVINKRVACKSGCYHCCFLLVAVSKDEAILLYEYIKHKKLNIDWERLREQRNAKCQNGTEYLQKVPYATRRCVFLGEDGKCNVYEYRPITCRGYFSADTSENCRTENGSMLAAVINYKTTMAIQCAAHLAGEAGWLADMLLKLKEKEKSQEEKSL